MREGIDCNYEYVIEYLLGDDKTYCRATKYNQKFEQHNYTKATEVLGQAREDFPNVKFKLFMYTTRIVKEAIEV
jgi:hypothetical protein